MIDQSAVMDSAAARLERLGERLAAAGLGRLALVPIADLDADLAAAILAAARAVGFEPGERAARVVIVGNDGGRFWNLVSAAERATPDPVDTYSAARVGSELAALGGDSVLLYPGPCQFSLQRLGAACGFGLPSYLGMSIDPSFGTWFAFRAVAVTTVELAASARGVSTDVCADCVSRDCLAACPAGAPGPPGRFDLGACSGYRLADGSPCAADCLARRACPVGVAWQYPAGLMAHVYERSLDSIRRYLDEAARCR